MNQWTIAVTNLATIQQDTRKICPQCNCRFYQRDSAPPQKFCGPVCRELSRQNSVSKANKKRRERNDSDA